MDDWCQRSCLAYPPNCPADKCRCLSHCEAVGRLAGQVRHPAILRCTALQPGTDVFCHRNCLRYPPHCPAEDCKCYSSPVSTPALPDGNTVVESRVGVFHIVIYPALLRAGRGADGCCSKAPGSTAGQYAPATGLTE